MKNLFDEKAVELMLSPEKWKLAADFLPEEAETAPNISPKEASEKRMSRHFQREIFAPLAGNYNYGFNGKYYKCVPGTIFLIDSNVEHELCYTRYSRNLLHLWFFVEEDKILGNYLRIDKGKMENRLKIILRYSSDDMNLYKRWSTFRKSKEKHESFCARRKMLFVLTSLFTRIMENKAAPETDLPEYQYELIEMTKNRIQKNFRHGVSIEQLARIGGYSKFHFLRLFRKNTGFTIHEYLNVCRINEMQNLLKANLNLKEIAYHLGFSSLQAFSNWRRKIKSSNLSEIRLIFKENDKF